MLDFAHLSLLIFPASIKHVFQLEPDLVLSLSPSFCLELPPLKINPNEALFESAAQLLRRRPPAFEPNKAPASLGRGEVGARAAADALPLISHSSPHSPFLLVLTLPCPLPQACLLPTSSAPCCWRWPRWVCTMIGAPKRTGRAPAAALHRFRPHLCCTNTVKMR